MTNEIVKHDKGDLIVGGGPMDGFEFDASDIKLPLVLLMQNTSKWVNDDTARPGDIINSLSGEKLGDKTTPVEFIPLKFEKFWTVLTKEGGKFIKRMAFLENPVNNLEGITKDRDGNDVPAKFQLTYSYYVLVTKNAGEEMGLPGVLSFKSTSLSAGKTLNALLTEYQVKGAPDLSRTFTLGCSKTENDSGVFHIWTIGKGQAASGEQINTAKRWKQMILATPTIKVDDGVEAETVDTSTKNQF